jgi:hypothetical protein
MGYIQEVEHKLRQYLVSFEAPVQDEIIKYVKTRILESYKNGIEQSKMQKVYGPKRKYPLRSTRK